MNSSMEMQAGVGIGPQLVIMGTILGSLAVGVTTFMITQNSSLGGAGSLLSFQTSNPAESGPQVNTVAEVPSIDSGQDVGAGQENVNQQISVEQSGCPVSSKFPESILQWCGQITAYADEYGLSPDLIAAVMLQESGGDPEAYSHSGAVGLMQVMPRDGIASSFMCINGPCFSSRPSISELQDPDFNVEYGARMLANLQARYGSIRDALKFYGPMDVGYTYADKVLAIFENYQE